MREHQGIERFTAGLDGHRRGRGADLRADAQPPGPVGRPHRPGDAQDRDPRRGARPHRRPDRPGPAARPTIVGGAPPAPRRARVRRRRDRRSARASPPGGRRPTTRVVLAAGAAAEDVTGQSATLLGVDGGHRPDVPGVRAATACRCTTLGRRPRRLRRPRARRERPDRGPRDGDPDHGPLPRPVRRACPRSRGSPRPRRRAGGLELRADPRLVAAAQQRHPDRPQLARARSPRRSPGPRS